LKAGRTFRAAAAASGFISPGFAAFAFDELKGAASTQALAADSGLLSKESTIKYIAAIAASKIPRRAVKERFRIRWGKRKEWALKIKLLFQYISAFEQATSFRRRTLSSYKAEP
jgi:hypothetical protein